MAKAKSNAETEVTTILLFLKTTLAFKENYAFRCHTV
jgi:hypothetical protein